MAGGVAGGSFRSTPAPAGSGPGWRGSGRPRRARSTRRTARRRPPRPGPGCGDTAGPAAVSAPSRLSSPRAPRPCASRVSPNSPGSCRRQNDSRRLIRTNLMIHNRIRHRRAAPRRLCAVTIFHDLASGSYLLVTTFRKDGTAAPTPVWVVGDGDALAFGRSPGPARSSGSGASHGLLAGPVSRAGLHRRPGQGTATILDSAGTQVVAKLPKRRWPAGPGRRVAQPAAPRCGRHRRHPGHDLTPGGQCGLKFSFPARWAESFQCLLERVKLFLPG